MVSNDSELQNLLRLEVASKSIRSCLSFIGFSVFIFIYAFNCREYKLTIQMSMVLIFTVSVLRIILAKKINAHGRVEKRHWQLMVTYVWLNALGWSVAINVASYELKLTGIHFIAVVAILAGFLAASLVSLAYDVILFIPFQLMLLVPQIALILFLSLGPEKLDGLTLIPLYSMYLLYQLGQFKDYQRYLNQRLLYQLELERSNRELQKSQETLISQTAQLVHTSRLAALGEMSAGIAHEVNNPMAIISGSMQLIERHLQRGKSDPEAILKILSTSQRSVERVSKIIKGLRQFSQQSDSHPKEIVKIEDIINDTTSFCSEMLRARYIQLIIDPIPDFKIKCHPVQIS